MGGDSLSEMGIDRQLEQLCSVYAEKSDDELLDLHEQRDDLTDLAQQALAQVMQERKLSATGVPAEELSFRSKSVTLNADEVELPGLNDPIRINEAIRLLTEAEIPFRAVSYGESETGSGRSYRLKAILGLAIHIENEEAAMTLLQEKMNLMPWLAEGSVAEGFGSRIMLGTYNRNDAARVASALGAAEISYIWNDGRDDTMLEETEVRIEVHAKNMERAEVLIEQINVL